MDQPKQTNADNAAKPVKTVNRKIDNTTPSINPEVDYVNRTLP